MTITELLAGTVSPRAIQAAQNGAKAVSGYLLDIFGYLGQDRSFLEAGKLQAALVVAMRVGQLTNEDVNVVESVLLGVAIFLTSVGQNRDGLEQAATAVRGRPYDP